MFIKVPCEAKGKVLIPLYINEVSTTLDLTVMLDLTVRLKVTASLFIR